MRAGLRLGGLRHVQSKVHAAEQIDSLLDLLVVGRVHFGERADAVAGNA
jgi:hypothetical protein